jgi:geranylgeranyl pyrophosphate synthase
VIVQARRLADPPFVSLLDQLLAGEFTVEAMRALTPAAADVPPGLWARALRDPLAEMLGRPGKEFRGRLTALAFRLAGGRGDPPALLGAMLEIIHVGSMIVDDIEDDSRVRRGRPTLHRLFGTPLALNAGNWMYFFPLELAGHLGLSAEAELELRRRMCRTMLDCHYGQALDLGARLGEVPQHCLPSVALTISALKTGRLMKLAAAAGAIAAAAAPPTVDALAELGEQLGVGLQMLDDLGNLSGEAAPQKRFEDLRHGRITWPWAWAATLLDERSFRTLEDLGRRVAQGAGAEALAAELRSIVSTQGRLETHWNLDRALGALRAAIGASVPLQELEAELARLEASYG